jgi:hypothetical protein
VDLFQVLPIAYRAARRLSRWLEASVEGFPSRGREDLQSDANHLALVLTGQCACPCGQTHCPSQHHLATQPTSGSTVESFSFRAVIGPYGLRANSIAGGIWFALFHEEFGLRVGLVEFKRCHCCGEQYEGMRCLDCNTPFAPNTTEVMGTDWLILEGVFIGVRRWACGTGRKAHYYEQSQCREEEDTASRYPEITYHVIHGETCDHCPWQGCPNGHPRHPQRGTTLWVRAEFVGRVAQGGRPLPGLLEALAEGMQRTRQSFTDWRGQLLDLLGPHPLAVAEALFGGREEGTPTSQQLGKELSVSADAVRAALSRDLRPRAQEEIRRALVEHGFIAEDEADEAVLADWLRGESSLEAQWREEESEDGRENLDS